MDTDEPISQAVKTQLQQTIAESFQVHPTWVQWVDARRRLLATSLEFSIWQPKDSLPIVLTDTFNDELAVQISQDLGMDVQLEIATIEEIQDKDESNNQTSLWVGIGFAIFFTLILIGTFIFLFLRPTRIRKKGRF